MQAIITNIKQAIIANDWYSLLFLLTGGLVLYLITLKIVIPIIHYIIEKSPTQLDDVLIKRGVFRKLMILPSLLFISQFSYLIDSYHSLINKILTAITVWVLMVAFDKFLLAVNDAYDSLSIAKGKPIKGFVQIFEIILYLFGCIAIIAILLGQSPWVLLSGLGAMTAVLLLIFKDTILSLVASVRISANKLIELGDWVEMPQYGADGDVIDIALHNIQIQNWDKTITTIPTHKLLDDAFKNWKGMQQAGGRRIMRNINIDMTTIKFCDEEMLDRFAKINHLKDYLKQKKSEIEEYNKKVGEDNYINSRHLTNIGTFRAYIVQYINNHPRINHNLTTLIRQLQPGVNGLPIQIYAFTNTTAWGEYENIQSDIFDHLLSVASLFDLKLFQAPTGNDIKSSIQKLERHS